MKISFFKRLMDSIGLHTHDFEVSRTGEMNVHLYRYGVYWKTIDATFKVEKCRCGKETAWITELEGVRKDEPYEANPDQIIHPT